MNVNNILHAIFTDEIAISKWENGLPHIVYRVKGKFCYDYLSYELVHSLDGYDRAIYLINATIRMIRYAYGPAKDKNVKELLAIVDEAKAEYKKFCAA